MEIRPRPYDRLIEHAGTQHGFVLTADLEELGLTQVYLRKLAAAGRAEHRCRGLYRLTALPVTAHGGYHEAVLWAGGDAAVGGEAALALWDLADVNPRPIEVVTPPGHRARRNGTGHVVVRTAALRPDEVDFVDGIPVVVPGTAIRQALEAGMEGTLVQQAIDTTAARGLLQPLAEARLRVALADRHIGTSTTTAAQA
jgi:predicted transcriptional regulator of viral defense system